MITGGIGFAALLLTYVIGWRAGRDHERARAHGVTAAHIYGK